MKKLRSKLIVGLLIINAFSGVLSSLLTTPLVPELFGDDQSWAVDLLKSTLQNAGTLVFFAIFVVLGVREITAPVLRLAKAANRIAEGDYNIEIAETRRKDEIGQLEKSFAVMAKELQDTEYLQKDFISNVSHEYKTPLAVIDGYARLLGKPGISDAERSQYSSFIVEETHRLSQMTSDILLLSKLENASIPPRFAPFSLDEQLRQAALLYFQKCEDKQITLETDIPSLYAYGNEELLMHVWTNLLENAVKFSSEHGTVTVDAHAGTENIVVTVRDDGIGMDAQTKARVFEQFYQGDTSHRAAGNGLGLSLAQRIVQLHHGSIQVDSAPGKGTAIGVMLPRQHRSKS